MSNLKKFMDQAQVQLKNCAIPTVVAITASVILSKLRLSLIALGALAAGGYAYYKGYRVRVLKPTETDQNAQ